jgi:hypothetical protein
MVQGSNPDQEKFLIFRRNWSSIEQCAVSTHLARHTLLAINEYRRPVMELKPDPVTARKT